MRPDRNEGIDDSARLVNNGVCSLTLPQLVIKFVEANLENLHVNQTNEIPFIDQTQYLTFCVANLNSKADIIVQYLCVQTKQLTAESRVMISVPV